MTVYETDSRVLLLAPSQGFGGGIERVMTSVESAFQRHAVVYRRLDLADPQRPLTIAAKLQYALEIRRLVRASPGPVRLIVASLGLLPVLYGVARLPRYAGATVIVHCTKCLRGRPFARRRMRGDDVRVVTVSNFLAGYAAPIRRATVMHPLVAPEWYHALVAAGERARDTTHEGIRLVTAARFGAWREKGVDRVIGAVSRLARSDVELTVCGSGRVPDTLRTLIEQHPWCRLVSNPDSERLAQHLAEADLFVHGYRTIAEAGRYGEGFAIVLIEAQLAGTPVVAPFSGGSFEAIDPGVTGLVPLDETTDALRAALAELLADKQRLARMGEAAAAWARPRFEPRTQERRIVRALLGEVRQAP